MEKAQIESIRRSASSSKALRDVLSIFKDHERAYFSATLRSMRNALLKKGIKHSFPDVRDALKSLADAGAGTLVKGNLGDVRLEKMRLSTMELGALVSDDAKNLRQYSEARKARGVDKTAEAVAKAPETLKVYPMRRSSSLSITLTINGAEVVLPLPPNLNPEQLAVLIERLKRVEDGYDPRRK